MKFYRYVVWNLTTEFDLEVRGGLWLQKFSMVRETREGHWIIGPTLQKEKWISKNAMKKFAYPTVKEAMKNFKKRTAKHWCHLKHRVALVQSALEYANNLSNFNEKGEPRHGAY